MKFPFLPVFACPRTLLRKVCDFLEGKISIIGIDEPQFRRYKEGNRENAAVCERERRPTPEPDRAEVLQSRMLAERGTVTKKL